MDCYALITEVHKRDALWKRRHPHHHHRGVLEKLWTEVAETLGITVNNARKKWKNLKDHYRNELRREQDQTSEYGIVYKSVWLYYDKLNFLESEIPPRVKKIPAPVQPEEVENFSEESATLDGDNLTKLNEIVPSSNILLQPELNPQDVDNYHFFMSLLPHIRHFDSMRTLSLRIKIQQLIMEATNEMQTSNDTHFNDNLHDTFDTKPFKM